MHVRHTLSLVAASLLLGAHTPTLAPINIYMIGDSTMADKPDPAHNPERGWGQALPEFVDDDTHVHNYAVNGRSTKSFIDEGRWETVRSQLTAGDIVLIQFGHNDEKREDSLRFAAPRTAYRANLERFVRETRERGATPIVFTPIVRRQFGANGALQNTHGEYPDVVRDLARTSRVALVDLNVLTQMLVQQRGVEGSKQLYVWTVTDQFPAFPIARQDNTHLTPLGASAVARLAAHALKAMEGPLAAHIVGTP